MAERRAWKTHTVNIRITEQMYIKIVKIIAARSLRTGKMHTVGGWVRDLVKKELKEVTDVKEYKF